MTKSQELEYIRCLDDPHYFIEKYLTIFDQTVNKIVPFRLFDFQKEAISYYIDNRFVITNKYRQAGMTTTTCAYLAYCLIFKEHQYVAVVANQLGTAKKILKTINEFIKGCPEWLKPKEVKKDQSHKSWDNRNEAKAFASTEIRGFTPTMLFWDETAHSPDGISFWTSTYPSLATGGRAIFVSSPLGMDPVFAKTFMDVKNGITKKWVAFEIYWYQDPRYSKDLSWVNIKENKTVIAEGPAQYEQLFKDGYLPTSPWYEEMKLEYFSKGRYREFSQEIESSFVGSSSTLISDDILEKRIAEDVIEPIRKEGFSDNVWIFKESELHRTYTMGVDVALGTSDDFSTFSIICNETKEQVAEFQGKVHPGEFGNIVHKYGMIYNEAYAIIDVTGGAGSETISKILTLGYKNVHYCESKRQGLREVLNEFLKHIDDKTFIPGFVINSNNRILILQTMMRQIIDHEIIIRSSRFYSEQKTFLYLGAGRFADHMPSTHDDLIFCTSIAMYVLEYVKDLASAETDKLKSMLNSYIVVKSGLNGASPTEIFETLPNYDNEKIKPSDLIKPLVGEKETKLEPSLFDYLLDDNNEQNNNKKNTNSNDFGWLFK